MLQPNAADVVISVNQFVEKPTVTPVIEVSEEVSIGLSVINFFAKRGIEGSMLSIRIPAFTVSLGSLLYYTFNATYSKIIFHPKPKPLEAPLEAPIATRIDNMMLALTYLHGGAWYFRPPQPQDNYA